MELDRSGSTYTFDTLTSIRHEYPKADLFYVIGADTLMQLRNWHRSDEVLPLCTFLICPREDGSRPAEYLSELKRLSAKGGRFLDIPMKPLTVSSTAIRAALSAGILPDALPVPVREYCRCKGLYGYPGRLDRADLWIEQLFSSLKPGRFAHSLSVAETARKLAEIHGADPLRAEQAGLLHDCAKYIPMAEMRHIAAIHHLTDDPAILESGALLHSIVGAQVAEDRYGMTDSAVLEAIRYHNTGCAGMSRLAMCVCLADSIEPLRSSYPLLEKVRALSGQSLERALLLSLEGTAAYVESRGKYLHPRTRETIRWLRDLAGSDL
jgi:nicotinate-nucleotide adenylyltransferase